MDGHGDRQPLALDTRARRAVRRAGLSPHGLTFDSIERRRIELWSLTVVVLVALASVFVLLYASDHLPFFLGSTSPLALQTALGLLALAFLAYVVEKERHLRRLEATLVDERVLASAYAARVAEITTLASASRAVNAHLDPEGVLEVVLAEALRLLRLDAGAALLAGDGGFRVVAARGDERVPGEVVPLDREPLADAIRRRRPVLTEPARGGALVPLVHRDEVLGVLELYGPGGVGDYELQVLTVFADYVAVSVANARLYAAQCARVTELTELDRLKSEFIATVSHELRTPLASIFGCTVTLRKTLSQGSDPEELLSVLERQGRRLGRMVDQLLAASRLDQIGDAPLDGCADLAALGHAVAREFELAGRRVELSAPASCHVRGDADLYERVVSNLLDNAHKYGAPPVRVEIKPGPDSVVLTVSDAGPGIPPADRERVFLRFCRLEPGWREPGMGLGLPIVRRVVEASGGRVSVDDAPGGGTVVRVVVPAWTAAEAPPQASGNVLTGPRQRPH